MLFLRTHLHFHNPRIQYGVLHLPEAFFLTGLFTALAGFLFIRVSKSPASQEKSTSSFIILLVVAFFLCWLPILLRAGFVQDDWMVIAAAMTRKIIFLHPLYAWFSLDTVNGNFRPLVTTLYFGYMLKIFGLHAFALLCGNFIVNLLGSIVAFFVVRELGYSKTAGAIASLLYMTRGLNYTLNAWACALGDGIVILLGGLIVLGILRANRRTGITSFAYHALAWLLFIIAAFAKQSAFTIPLIVALLVLLRPGQTVLPSLRRRIGQTILILISYSIPTLVIFFQARSLLRTVPYPISLTLSGFTQLLGYITWYFIGFEVPGPYKIIAILTDVVGAAICVGLVILVLRIPALLGKRPRDIAFLLASSLASISLYILLPTRTVAYYGAASAFWLSIAIGIAITQLGGMADRKPSARNAYIALYLIVILGFFDIRVKQTGLISSGGYIWGTYGMDREKNLYDQMSKSLASLPDAHTLVMVDFPASAPGYISMALIADPDLQRILCYDSKTKTYFVNDLGGSRPENDMKALSDVQAYWWNLPIDSAEAAQVTGQSKIAWLKFDGETIRSISPLSIQAE
ncbi:MAG: hypothetical protein ABI177_00985 [Edaphobacter sp.]